MLKTMRVVFALGLIIFSFDLFRPKPTDNILIGKWGPSWRTFIFQPDGMVEFHASWMTFTSCVNASIKSMDNYCREWKETNDEPSPETTPETKHIFTGRYETYDCGKLLLIDIKWTNVDERPLPENPAWRTLTNVLFDYRDWRYQMTVNVAGDDFQHYKSDVK